MERKGDERQGRPDYLSYLLRLWRVTVAGQVVWRASLECPHTGERLGFADLDGVWDFLQARIESQNGPTGRTQHRGAARCAPQGKTRKS